MRRFIPIPAPRRLEWSEMIGAVGLIIYFGGLIVFAILQSAPWAAK
jgi:hypothetical protein